MRTAITLAVWLYALDTMFEVMVPSPWILVSITVTLVFAAIEDFKAVTT